MFAGADQPGGRGVVVEVVVAEVVVELAAVGAVVEDEPVAALLVEHADKSTVKSRTPISVRTNLRSPRPGTIGTYSTGSRRSGQAVLQQGISWFAASDTG
jgi:hypothetical protein